MKKFLLRLGLFFLVLVLFFLVGLFLPPTPMASKTLLFAKIRKDSLLKNVDSPRIIFIGGSNTSFGINSQIVRDSLGLFPINTGIHMSLGLIYMIDNTLPYIRKGDIVIISAEYQQFFDNFAYGSEELLRTIMDMTPTKIFNLRKKQFVQIYKSFPRYSFSKFSPREYFYNYSKNIIYSVNSFNKYGDACAHWSLKPETFKPDLTLGDIFNQSIIDELVSFNTLIKEKKASLYITFPGYQSSSYENVKKQIQKVETAIMETKLSVLGNSARYKFEDYLIFNSPYHLTKKGMDIRTLLLIDDIKKAIRNFK